jgi:hypothetical protein
VIQRIVTTIVTHLNDHLNAVCPGGQRSRAVAAELRGTPFTPLAALRDRLVVQVVRIEEQPAVRQVEPRRAGAAQPALAIDLICAGCFDDYQAGLEVLSAAIDCVRSTPVITGADGLTVRMTLQPMSWEAQGQLWGQLRHPYLPSIVIRATG